MRDFWEVPGVLAFAVGLVLAFCFDTSGPRTRIVARERPGVVPNEDAHEHRPAATGATTGEAGATATRDRSVAEELRTREASDEGAEPVSAPASSEHMDRHVPERRDAERGGPG